MNNHKLSLNNYPKTQYSTSVSPRFQRPHSEISLVSATNRDFDLRDRLNHIERKLAKQHKLEQDLLLRTQKWKYRVEKNIVLRDYKQVKATSNQLTPSIDDWLRMNVKTKHLVLSSNDLPSKR
jgi:hypothetical protein